MSNEPTGIAITGTFRPYPSVGTIFDSLDHGQGLMVAADIVGNGIVVKDAGPKHCATQFRGHGYIDAWKLSLAALLNVIPV
jgi:hypothetical protein